MVISNHNSFRLLFDKIASIYFIWKIYYIFALEMASPGNLHWANCIGALSFPIGTVKKQLSEDHAVQTTKNKHNAIFRYCVTVTKHVCVHCDDVSRSSVNLLQIRNFSSFMETRTEYYSSREKTRLGPRNHLMGVHTDATWLIRWIDLCSDCDAACHYQPTITVAICSNWYKYQHALPFKIITNLTKLLACLSNFTD